MAGTVADEEYRRAVGYATSAIELLKRATIPPYPQFYELLYIYATGVNPALNARLNAVFATGEPSVEVAEKLYHEFLTSQDANERLTGVSARMSNRIEAMHDAIDTAMATANAYSATLQTANGDLAVELPAVRLKQLANSLLGETRRMQSANMALERTLESYRAEIATLQRDLDDVRREALLDPLTKVHNRKAFDDGLLRAVGHATETGRPLCLMLIDIDHFKEFNDRFGHAAGDEALRRIARDLMATVRSTDFVFRFGGEEFMVICDALPSGAALALGERIRREIAGHVDTATGRITVSVGVATCAEDAPDYDSLFLVADRRLYSAKAAGRNCVIGERVASTENPVRLVFAG